MGIHDPCFFTVSCDRCDKEERFASTDYADGSFGVADETLDENGWSHENGERLCSDCLQEIEEEEEPEEQCAGCGAMFEASNLDINDNCPDCALAEEADDDGADEED